MGTPTPSSVGSEPPTTFCGLDTRRYTYSVERIGRVPGGTNVLFLFLIGPNARPYQSHASMRADLDWYFRIQHGPLFAAVSPLLPAVFFAARPLFYRCNFAVSPLETLVDSEGCWNPLAAEQRAAGARGSSGRTLARGAIGGSTPPAPVLAARRRTGATRAGAPGTRRRACPRSRPCGRGRCRLSPDGRTAAPRQAAS
jgi:hypothetical protein